MTKEYSTTVDLFKELPDGGEVELLIRDLTPGPRKYDAKRVLAKVASSVEKLPDGDKLWLRSMVGNRLDKPWAIKILKELEESTLPKRPYSEMFKEE
jgi:hypothetical protein